MCVCDTGVSDSELVELLDTAGLTELLQRVGSLDSSVDWNWSVAAWSRDSGRKYRPVQV